MDRQCLVYCLLLSLHSQSLASLCWNKNYLLNKITYGHPALAWPLSGERHDIPGLEWHKSG